MLSKSEFRLLCNLSKKKFREKHRLYLVEGRKLVQEAAGSRGGLVKVFYTKQEEEFVQSLGTEAASLCIEEGEMAEITNQVTFPGIIALLEIAESKWVPSEAISGPMLILDGLRDPGNMGTILRTADWFGIRQVLCSIDCVDVFNPKVVQASMGSIFRVKVNYAHLPAAMQEMKSEDSTYSIAGAALEGELLHSGKEWTTGALVIGSESHGIRSEVAAACDELVRIPGGKGTESLNASIAASILMYQWLSPRS